MTGEGVWMKDGFPPQSSRGQALRGNNGWGWNDVGGERAVPEPPLRVASKVGFNNIVAVNFEGNDRFEGTE